MVIPTSSVTADRNRWGSVASSGTMASLPREASGLPQYWRQSRSERVSAAAMVVMLHAAVIAVAMLSRFTGSTSERPALTAFNVKTGGGRRPHRSSSRPRQSQIASPLPTTPAPLLQVAEIDPVQNLPDVSPVADISVPEMPVTIGGGCDLTQPVQDALRQNVAVRRQLPAIPADRRSVANAIVMWNVNWIDAEAAPAPAQAAFATIRQTITQVVTASSADCRNQLQRGPRLLYLPGTAGKTMVLALGSGQWTWQQLVDGRPLPAEVVAAGLAPPPAAPFASLDHAALASSQTPAVDALLANLLRRKSPAQSPYYP